MTGAPPRRTLRDGERARAELTGGGELLRWHTPWGHLGATGDARRYAGRAVWADPLGSVRAVVDERGVVVQATDYYAFGLQMPGRVWRSDSETREGYTGHELDPETGLNYAGARYYDSALGRWHVVDPLWAQFPSYSPYNYVLGDPINLMDPDGMAPCCVDEGKAFIGGAVGAVSSRVNGAVNYVRGATVEGVAQDVYNNVLTNDGMSGGEYLDHLAQGPSLDERASDAYASTVAFVETSDSEQLAAAAGVVAVGVVIDRLTGGKGGSRTEPTLPDKTIANQNGVTVEHNYRSGDHGPAHAHVVGGGETTRIGQNGKPLKGNPELSRTQQQVVQDNRSTIRKAVGKIGRWLDYNENKDD